MERSADKSGILQRIPVVGAVVAGEAPATNPWTVGNRILGLDPELRRLWIGGQRLHHGLTGIAMTGAAMAQLATRRSAAARAIAWALAGGVLMAHDWKDRSVWFRVGAQSD